MSSSIQRTSHREVAYFVEDYAGKAGIISYFTMAIPGCVYIGAAIVNVFSPKPWAWTHNQRMENHFMRVGKISAAACISSFAVASIASSIARNPSTK